MKLARSVSEILRDHVTLEAEGIDRIDLNVRPRAAEWRRLNGFFRECRGHSFASSALMAPMTRAFVDSVESYVRSEELDVVTFEKKQRKEDVAAEYRTRFRGDEGVLFVGKAQEKAAVFDRRACGLWPDCDARIREHIGRPTLAGVHHWHRLEPDGVDDELRVRLLLE
jgi:hypothetical protein